MKTRHPTRCEAAEIDDETWRGNGPPFWGSRSTYSSGAIAMTWAFHRRGGSVMSRALECSQLDPSSDIIQYDLKNQRPRTDQRV